MKKRILKKKPISNQLIKDLTDNYKYKKEYKEIKCNLNRCKVCYTSGIPLYIKRYKTLEVLLKEHNCLTVDDALSFGHVTDPDNMFAICSPCMKIANQYMIDGIRDGKI